MNRHSHTAIRTTGFIQSMNCLPDELPLDVYRDISDALDLNFRYGWLAPVWLDHSRRQVIVPFCPEMIALLGDHLGDEEFDLYLSVGLQLIAGSIALLDDLDDPIERLHAAENQLLQLAPTAFPVLSDVQLHAIDAGLVRF